MFFFSATCSQEMSKGVCVVLCVLIPSHLSPFFSILEQERQHAGHSERVRLINLFFSCNQFTQYKKSFKKGAVFFGVFLHHPVIPSYLKDKIENLFQGLLNCLFVYHTQKAHMHF